MPGAPTTRPLPAQSEEVVLEPDVLGDDLTASERLSAGRGGRGRERGEGQGEEHEGAAHRFR